MLLRLRRFLDVRPGEGLSVLLTFLYIAVVVAAFLLAKPIRNGLFLEEYGPYSLVYVYGAVPIALSLFVPLYTRAVARVGGRLVTVATLLFFGANVLLFWLAFRFYPFKMLSGVFFVWVNCFGIIAPVQAWSFANSLFDTRQAKRLFGLIGAGASFGAITGGVLARYLVEPVGGAVNMLLVLAAVIGLAAVIVSIANTRLPRKKVVRLHAPSRDPIKDAIRQIAASPYLRVMTALVFLVAIATQWTAFQLSLVADERFAGDATGLTRFFGTFNLTLGTVSFLLQLLVTGPALRRFGIAVTVLVLPIALGFGTALIWLIPAHLDGAPDECLRSGLPLLGRQGELRAAVSADPPGSARPAQERDRHRRQPRGRRIRSGAARARDPGLLRRHSRARPRAARHGGDQPGVHPDLDRRGVALADRICPDDPREHPPAPPRYGARGIDHDRKVGGRGAAREARGRRRVGGPLCARIARGAAGAQLATGAAVASPAS